MKMTVRGTKQLSKKLNALQDSVQGKMLERALVSGALLIQNDAKRRAAYETGNLRRSIHIGGHENLNPDGGNIVDTAGSPVPDPKYDGDTVTVYVGTDVEYAAYVEFGTSKMAAQPYLRPAADSQRGAVQKEVGDALKDLIKAAT